jgi:uncharacterized protein YdhG (YjbR/CyaY superfamily)
LKTKSSKPAKTVSEYIERHSKPVQQQLKTIRKIIKKNAPEAVEKIGYGMPAYSYLGALMYFAAYEKHIGLYAMPSVGIRFEKELEKYKTSKGTIRFLLGEKLPESLIAKIVKFRVKENVDKKKLKKNQPNLFR